MSKHNLHFTIGNIGQWLSVFTMLAGIYYLITLHIDLGTVLFSIGCIIDVLATKIKYYGAQFVKRNKKIVRILRSRKRFHSAIVDNTAVGGLDISCMD